jgi:hypothetical protein
MLGIIGVLAHVDAPARRPRAKQQSLALFDREAAGYDAFARVDERLAGIGVLN